LNYGSRSSNAWEVETGDYKLKRCLAISERLQLESLFYGPTDGELYAVTRAALGASRDEETRLSLLRVGGEGQEEPERELSTLTRKIGPAVKLFIAGPILLSGRQPESSL
jgi:hypothetical protein